MRLISTVLLFSGVAAAQLRITTTTVPSATQYQSYATTLNATGGTPPYKWSVVSSTSVSLPEGMSLDAATGVVSATQVNGQGGYSVTIQVADSASPSNATANATLNFGVNSDSSYGGCQMFPADSIYNQRIDKLPVDTNPAHQIPSAYLTAPLHPDFGHGFYPAPAGIPFMRVPANQPPTNVNMGPAGTFAWPFPGWPNAVIEGTSYGASGDDHHILIVQSSVNNINGPQTGACILYETYQSTSVPSMWNAATGTWSVGAGISYNLNSNAIAASEADLDNGPQDSAGIPMVPLLVRYAEVPLGVRHPLRITFPSPTNWFVWPATGCCTGSGPPQGLLYRLKASVNWAATCPANLNPQAATVLQALQQYGAYMSDHGSSGFMQGVPDIRWDDNDLACIKKFHVSDLEVVDNSMLEVSDISGQTKPYVAPASLPAGAVNVSYGVTLSGAGGNPANWQWLVSSGALPSGLSLDAVSGAITGFPGTSTGSPFNFGVTLKDTVSGLSSAEQPFSISVSGGGNTVSVTVGTAPAGRTITVDGTNYTAPQTFSWVDGSSHTVNAPSPQGTGTRYVYASWSDGGPQSHPVTASAGATYTATYNTQYLLTTGVSPAGAGTITPNPASGDGYYNSGAVVQLTASASGGYVFSSLSGDLAGSANPQSVTMSAPRTVTANFSAAGTAPGVPSLTSPSNGSTGVTTNPTLTWKTDAGATAYDVYFGTTPSPAFAGTTTSTSYGVKSLKSTTTYYWKVVARNSWGATGSATWSFTTKHGK